MKLGREIKSVVFFSYNLRCLCDIQVENIKYAFGYTSWELKE